MKWTEWIIEVEDVEATKQSKNWLHREAFYDGFSLEDAIRIATDPEQVFRNDRGGGGWRYPVLGLPGWYSLEIATK